MDVFDIIAFAVLIVAAVVIIVLLGSLPGNIAARRGHPQASAIAVAGWLGLVTGVFWLLAFIWSFTTPVPREVKP